MTHPNQAIIDRFYDLYGRRELSAMPQVLAGDVRWVFPARNPFSGVHRGIDALVALFDRMGSVMGSSNLQFTALLDAANDNYAVQARYTRTHRDDGNNLDHQWCVSRTFANGKIVDGRHLAADQYAVDEFFNRVGT